MACACICVCAYAFKHDQDHTYYTIHGTVHVSEHAIYKQINMLLCCCTTPTGRDVATADDDDDNDCDKDTIRNAIHPKQMAFMGNGVIILREYANTMRPFCLQIYAVTGKTIMLGFQRCRRRRRRYDTRRKVQNM